MNNENFDKYYVLDTNILLEDANNIFNLSDDNKNLIILPETVLDEIDSKKSGFDEINFQAREFARILDELYERYKEELTSLDYEERLMNKSWGKRRKNLELIKKTTGSFIGAFQAYSGNAISEIKALEVSEA